MMNLTGGYNLPKTNGNITHDDFLIFDSQSTQQLHNSQRPSPPFYLLSHFPLEEPPTGSTNLIVHWKLNRDYEKYVKQTIPPSLSDFLTDIPLAETAQQKAASFAGDAHGGVGTLRSLFSGPIITKEIVPLTEQQLNAFRLHREPLLPDKYQIYASSPKEIRSATMTDTVLPPPVPNPISGPSPQVQRVISEPASRVSPDVKRKAPSDTTPVLAQQQITTPIAGPLSRTTSTPTLSGNTSIPMASGLLNDDQDEMNLSKRKTKKTKKEKKV